MMQNGNGHWRGLANQVLGVLCSPTCGSSLHQNADGLVCELGGRQYPALNGVVHFVDAQNCAGVGGFPRKSYVRKQLERVSCHRPENALRRTELRPRN